jgi:hypothetical protein
VSAALASSRSATLNMDRAAAGEFIRILDEAVHSTGNRFPINAVLGALERELGGRPVVIGVPHDGDTTAAAFCRFEGARVRRVSIAPPDAPRWAVERAHLYAVVANPAPYLDDPMRLCFPPFSLCVRRPAPSCSRRRPVPAFNRKSCTVAEAAQ